MNTATLTTLESDLPRGAHAGTTFVTGGLLYSPVDYRPRHAKPLAVPPNQPDLVAALGPQYREA